MSPQVTQESSPRRLDLLVASEARLSPTSRAINGPANTPYKPPSRYLALFLTIFGLSVAISVASVRLLDPAVLRGSLYDLANFTGPVTKSLLHGGGLSFCTDATGFGGSPICFHAARMPVASFVVGAGILLFGDSFVRVSIFKILLFLLPLEFAVYLVCRRMPASRFRRTCCALLLLAPFGMTTFIANVINLQVEEDYAYSLIACALAIVLFGPRGFADWKNTKTATKGTSSFGATGSHPIFLLLFVLAADGLYLSKSSMWVAVGVLAAAFFLQQSGKAARVAVAALVLAAPVGWAMYLHHASGRYKLGTSLDGMNLHKGNGAIFMAHYPPPPLTSLDDYDDELNRGQSFSSEWSLNDYHMRAAIDYIRTHPRETLIGEWRKFRLLYLSITKYGSSDSHGMKLMVEKGGLILFRVIFWASIGFSLFALISPRFRSLREAAATYLALCAACALPYLIGFGYTRHASILIYPACLMGCRILCADEFGDEYKNEFEDGGAK